MQFESSLGKNIIKSKQLKEIDIPDESDFHQSSQEELEENSRRIREFQDRMQSQPRDIYEVEKEMREAREVKRTGKERLSEGARRRIEMLIGMTRTTRTVDIDGNTFSFQSLKAKEMRDAISSAAAFDGSVQSPFEIRKQLLARSITQIAGVEFEQFIGSNTLEDRLNFIEELDDALLNRLYDEYLKLAQEAKIKFAIKTEADAKEVVQDLKK